MSPRKRCTTQNPCRQRCFLAANPFLRRVAIAGLGADYGSPDKIPVPQVFLTLIEAGDTLPAVPKLVLLVVQRVLLPVARALGYKATYPEYTSTGRTR